MADEYVSLREHKEFAQRIDRENERQNERLKQLESSIDEINRLAISTERLASSMEQMLEEQKAQGKRISKLGDRDGEKWRQVVGYTITAIISLVLGYLVKVIF